MHCILCAGITPVDDDIEEVTALEGLSGIYVAAVEHEVNQRVQEIYDIPLGLASRALDERGGRHFKNGGRVGRWRRNALERTSPLRRGYGRMAVEFLDPLGRGGKPSNIPGGICWYSTCSTGENNPEGRKNTITRVRDASLHSTSTPPLHLHSTLQLPPFLPISVRPAVPPSFVDHEPEPTQKILSLRR
jgi:hypothetical protein